MIRIAAEICTKSSACIQYCPAGIIAEGPEIQESAHKYCIPARAVQNVADRLTAWAGRSDALGSFFGMKFPPDHSQSSRKRLHVFLRFYCLDRRNGNQNSYSMCAGSNFGASQ